MYIWIGIHMHLISPPLRLFSMLQSYIQHIIFQETSPRKKMNDHCSRRYLNPRPLWNFCVTHQICNLQKSYHESSHASHKMSAIHLVFLSSVLYNTGFNLLDHAFSPYHAFARKDTSWLAKVTRFAMTTWPRSRPQYPSTKPSAQSLQRPWPRAHWLLACMQLPGLPMRKVRKT